ncbi:MAG: hypothetical protein N2Z22_09115 [Turneriella sp.]|nr:hypothetical protein [Leptospiraceae bacterium]MCX7633476.1 hypothetical protein [Turneriella sp.]
MVKISALWCFILLPLFAEFDTGMLPAALRTRVDKFLEAETTEARGMLAQFTDAELEKITQAFKKSHDTSEQRLFWLTEEFYRRNAERIARERIHYLYAAVLAAIAILLVFTILTYRRAKKIVPTQARPEPPALTAKGQDIKPPRRHKSARNKK